MKAIALISGGLDSILAAKLIQEQKIDVLPLNFKIPFCHRNKYPVSTGKEIGAFVLKILGKELKTIDISEDFLELLVHPRHGFGGNMNPCIDCKILMLKKTKELLASFEASFVITGEVLGQRPMSQHRQALDTIAQEAGLANLVLRPLSAKLLPETNPEIEGWVQREKLLNFSGRTRRPQIELANRLRIDNYNQPAGGCLLTDPVFSRRLKELIAHQELTIENITLLKIGRHFRITDKLKLIVGRDMREDQELETMARTGDYLFYPNALLAGPTSLGRGELNSELIKLSCQLTCHYCDLNGKPEAEIVYRKLEDQSKEGAVNVLPASDEQVFNYRI